MGASREKIYSELDLKSLQDRRCFMFFFLSGFSFTDIHDSQSSRGRGRLSLYFNSSLPVPPTSQIRRH